MLNFFVKKFKKKTKIHVTTNTQNYFYFVLYKILHVDFQYIFVKSISVWIKKVEKITCEKIQNSTNTYHSQEIWWLTW